MKNKLQQQQAQYHQHHMIFIYKEVMASEEGRVNEYLASEVGSGNHAWRQ